MVLSNLDTRKVVFVLCGAVLEAQLTERLQKFFVHYGG
jgi:hypothetical protein